MRKLKLLALVILWLLMLYSITKADDVTNYMTNNWLTQEQEKYVIEKSKEVKNPDHFVRWFVAIQAHEQGTTFVDWKTKYLAGRIKKWMEYKDFKTQLDWRTLAYNKYWYKNNTASDWIRKSKYCVSDTHWGGKWCPNWVKNVPAIASQYQKQKHDIGEIRRVKPTWRTCRYIGKTNKEWSTIQIDTVAGKFWNWLLWVPKDSKIFECD